MKLFDLHCDIGTDVEMALQRGEIRPFEVRHLKKLLDGEIGYVCCACFFCGNESWEDMEKMILDLEQELEKSDVVFVREKNDLQKEGRVHAIISVEGMCGIKDKPREKIQFMASHHVKIASLAWNEENYLATGKNGNVIRGITIEGYEAMDEMAKQGIILDVSHLNEASFWDVITHHTGKVCATHSNARTLCNHDRNLTDQQIRAIAKRGGIIGMNACADFVDEDIEKQDALHLAKHARYIADLVGVSHLACGFDFMDFLGDCDAASEMVRGLESSNKAQNFVKALEEVGFNEGEIQAICYQNALDFFSE